MQIKHIQISSFGKLSDLDLDLSPGLNIIEGNNESGKSTLLSFIKFMLYGAQNKPPEGLTVPERRLYVSWKDGRAGGSMTVESKGKIYRIERELSLSTRTDSAGAVKETFREHVAVIDEVSGSTVFSGKCPGEEFFGVPESVFLSTALVGQLSGAYVNGNDISTSIENLLFSADESVNVQKAISRLDDARKKLLHKSRRGGDIYELECQRSALREKASESRSSSGEIRDLEASVAEYSEKLRKNAARSDELGRLAEKNEAFAASKRFDIVHAHQNKLASIDAALANISGGDEKDEELLINLRARSRDFSLTRASCDAADAKVAEVTRANISTDSDEYIKEIYKMGGRDEAEYEFDRHRKKAKNLLAAAIILLIFALLSAGLAVAAYFVDAMIGYGVAIAALAVLAGSVTSFVCRSRHKNYIKTSLEKVGASRAQDYSVGLDNLFEIEKIKEQQRTEIAEARLSAEYARSRQNDAAKALAEVLIALGIPADQLDDEHLSAFESQLEEKITTKKSLLTDKERYSAALESALEQVAGIDEAEVRRTLEGVDLDELSQLNPTALRREREFLISSSSALTEKLSEKQQRLAALSAVTADPGEMTAKIEEIDKKIKELTLRHDAYTMAEEMLVRAGETLRTGLSPKLGAAACEMMNAMTGGKYDRLGVDSELSLSCRMDGITRETDYLSSGTRDLTYVALRLSLADLLYHADMPPIFFDETFARLDDNRLSTVLDLLSRLCRDGRQMLVFTCQKREALLATPLDFNKISLK